MEFLKRNFEVARGTQSEIDEAPGKDWCFYLATDTNQMYVGNEDGTKTPYNGERKIYAWVNEALEEAHKDVYGYKGTIIIDPSEYVKHDPINEDDVTTYDTEIIVPNMLSTDWIDIRPMTRRDKNIITDCDIFITCTATILTVSAVKQPDKKLYLDYFVTKGI